jgi:uncharacterized protein (TIGR02118 family)
MIVRSAVLEGTVAAADRERFDSHMRTTVLAAIARYPGIRDVRLRWPIDTEAGAPPVYCIFDLYFDSIEGMRAALASPIREAVRASIGEVMSAFNGKVYHLVVEDTGAADRPS